MERPVNCGVVPYTKLQTKTEQFDLQMTVHRDIFL